MSVLLLFMALGICITCLFTYVSMLKEERKAREKYNEKLREKGCPGYSRDYYSGTGADSYRNDA